MEQPSFFKVLLEPSAPHLLLPPTFVSKHLKNKIPKNPTLKSAKGGYSWKLKISRIGENYGFTYGWSSVVEDNKLGYGDFLVFKLIDESTFRFSIYSPNGCVKDFCVKDSCVKDFPKKVKVEEDVEEEEEEERVDFDFDDGDRIVEEGHSEAETEEEEEDSDEIEEDEFDNESEEEEDDDVDVDVVDDGGDEDEDDDGDGGIDGNDGDPFFTTTISKSKTLESYLRLPSVFVYLAGIDGEKNIILKNLDDHEWLMGLKSDMKNYHLSSGWNDFRRSNELLEGDECVFKFIKSEGKLALVKVTKKRPQRRQTLPPSVESSTTKERPQRQTLPPPPPVEKSPATKERPGRRQPPPLVEKSPATKEKMKKGRPLVEKSPVKKGRGSVDVEREDDGVEVVKSQPEKSPVQRSKINKDNDKDDCKIGGNDDDPFITGTFKKWNEYCVHLPPEFVKSNGLHHINRKPIYKYHIMKDLDQQEWELGLGRFNKNTYKFSRGWTYLWRKNKLSVGDKYMIKYIRREAKFSLVKVTETEKPPASCQSPPPVETPATEAVVVVESEVDSVEVVQRQISGSKP